MSSFQTLDRSVTTSFTTDTTTQVMGVAELSPVRKFIESIVDDADDVVAAANALDAVLESYHDQILGA